MTFINTSPTDYLNRQENKMTPNVGTIDRTLRLTVGISLVAAAALGYIGIWGYLGVLPILTGSFKFCPAYLPFGLSTCKTGK
jgi:hypothetical protein